MTDFRTLDRQLESINPSSTGSHYPQLESLSAPHVSSFNSLFEFDGGAGLLEKAVQDIGSLTIFDTKSDQGSIGKNKIEIWISGIHVGKPTLEASKGALNEPLFPAECRGRGISYKSKIQAKLNWRVNSGPIQTEVRNLGSIPIMVKVCLI